MRKNAADPETPDHLLLLLLLLWISQLVFKCFFLAPNTMSPTSHLRFVRPFAMSHFPLKMKTFSLFLTAFCPLKTAVRRSSKCIVFGAGVHNVLTVTHKFEPKQDDTHLTIALRKENRV